ncbi:MAG TPA: reverse transcriptase-like protein [Candidatus Saccharimonadales bacterium]
MKQKIVVRAIIKQEGKLFLLRRAKGRVSLLSRFELPGGEIGPHEQPEDALRRHIELHTSASIDAVQLFDALTFTDPEDNQQEEVILLYQVSLLSGNIRLLTDKYDKYIWRSLSLLQHENITDSTAVLLNTREDRDIHNDVKITQNDDEIIVYSDGGSRGNPGPSAAGYVVLNAKEQVLRQDGVYLGITTNNQAEYQAVYLGLLNAAEFTQDTVEFRIDSLLVVNQMNGIYQIKNRDLWPIHEKIKELRKRFRKVTFTHVKREFNHLADAMVNKVLDQHSSSKNSENTV